MLLECEALDLRWGRVHAVKGVSLCLAAGEIVTVLGANGAGKTSLLKAIQGLAPLAGGSIRFEGMPISGLTAGQRLRRGIALVPEGRQILVSLSVHENLLMGAYCRDDREIEADIDAIYRRFPHLAARRDMPASVLSGGEQQMLAISRAMLARPRLLMLDEPSLGLSPLLVDMLFALIRDLNRQGLSILLVEQNTRMALDIATRGYVLELGKIVAEGRAADLATDRRLVEAYLGAT